LAVVLFFALRATPALAQAPPAALAEQPPRADAILVTTSGTKNLYEITPDRAATLPPGDPRQAPDPPPSLPAARQAAETEIPLVRTFTLLSVGLFNFDGRAHLENCGPSGCWYYRMTFTPVIGGIQLSEEVTVVVLLDGSTVQPRAKTGLAAAPA